MEKLSQPVIPRQGLMKQLDDVPPGKLAYISAPAGFGKSVAAQLWAAQSPCHAVVSLDEYDNNITSLCRRVCAALMQLAPGNASVREMAMHPSFGSAPDEYTAHAVAALTPGLKGRLVFDDLHSLSDATALSLLTKLLLRLPADIRVLGFSRAKPAEALSEFIVKGALVQISEETLRFNNEEVQALYAIKGITLTKTQARTICEMTGGWAIGINAMLLSGQKAPDAKLLSQHLDNYIRTQVWERWDEDTRDFMLKTAVEDELTPSLCAALTGREDAGARLDALVASSAFIIESGDGVYHFHALFRRFLQGLLEKDHSLYCTQTQKAGLWYRQKEDYFKAIDAFLRCGNEGMVVTCINELSLSGKNNFVIGKILPLFQNPAVHDIVERNEYLMGLRGWAAFLQGRPEDMERDSDRVYESIGMIDSDPKQILKLLFQRCVDYRVSMRQFAAEVEHIPRGVMGGGLSATVTQNMPFFHRSARDMSEFASASMESDVEQLRQTIGILFGSEAGLFQNLLLAGLYYERGELVQAHKIALDAITDLKDDYASESKFCAMVLYIHILRAQWRYDRADLMVVDMERMIENDRAFFLSYNAAAYLARCKMDNGDTDAAEKWLASYGTPPLSHLDFFHLYGHFATARAHITLGNYDKAIVLLQKIVQLAQTYRRPLDVIEAKILLSIAFWQKKRGFQKEALDYLEEAIMVAHPYGYTQAFIDEGPELANMLFRLQNRANRKDYSGKLPGSFVRMLHIRAATHAEHSKGLTGGQPAKPVKYTAQQRQVMRLLCAGYSYRRIAEEMNIKFSTVRSHIELIYKKLDVPNEREAVQKIREQGILDEE